MKALRRLILVILLLVIVVVLGGALLFKRYGNQAVKLGVETGATRALNVKVALDEVDLRLFSGSIQLDGMRVSNPSGYENPYLLEFAMGKVGVDLGSLWTETIYIREILFDGLAVTIEQKGLTNNIQELLKGIESGQPGDETEPPIEEEGKPTKELIISRLVISNAQANVKLLPVPGKSDTVTIKLATIELHDLGRDKKADVAMVAKQVLTAILEGVAQQGAGLLPKDMLDGISGQLKSLEHLGADLLKQGGKLLEGSGSETGGGVLKETGKAGEELLKGAGEAGKGIVEGIGGLLGGKKEEAGDKE